MNLIERFDNAKQDLYDHVGFKEDWPVYPIANHTEMFWKIASDQKNVRFAETKNKFISLDGGYYFNEILNLIKYNKSIYRGKEFTMIFVDLTIDNIRYFAFFSNDKEIE